MNLDEMLIATRKRVLRRAGGVTHFVSHNPDFQVRFLFDALWEPYYWKTAYLTNEAGESIPVVFSGDVFTLPLLSAGRYTLGLSAGDALSSELFPFRICKSPQDDITSEVDAIAPSAYDRLTGMINSQVDDMVAALRTELQKAKDSGEFKGDNGITPHIGANGNWFIGEEDTGIFSGGSGGMTYGIGSGLVFDEETGTLSTEVVPESFEEITEESIRKIFNSIINKEE